MDEKQVEDKLNGMTKNEISQLLYCECCAVDRSGRLDSRRMNQDDHAIMQKWNEEGFIKYGRIAMSSIQSYNETIGHVSSEVYWCKLSDDAFNVAYLSRRRRAARGWANRKYETTSEKNGETID